MAVRYHRFSNISILQKTIEVCVDMLSAFIKWIKSLSSSPPAPDVINAHPRPSTRAPTHDAYQFTKTRVGEVERPIIPTRVPDRIIEKPPSRPTSDIEHNIRPRPGLPIDLRGRFRQVKEPIGRRQPAFKVEHPIAVFFDGSPEYIPFDYRKLEDDSQFIAIRRHALMTPDLKLHLVARLGPGVRHFYSPSGSRVGRFVIPTNDRADAVREQNPEHENEVRRLVGNLRRGRPASVFTANMYAYHQATRGLSEAEKPNIFDIKTVEQFVLSRLHNYEWTDNRSLISMEGINVRPDIVGIPYNRHISQAAPHIFIEVINTHFPSPATWNAYLEHSLKTPLIVLFAFTAKPNYYCEVRREGLRGHRGETDLRTIFSMFEGSLYRNTRPLRFGNVEYSSEAFKDLMKIELPKPGRPRTAPRGYTDDTLSQ
jgi:hypothetical protein